MFFLGLFLRLFCYFGTEVFYVKNFVYCQIAVILALFLFFFFLFSFYKNLILKKLIFKKNFFPYTLFIISLSLFYYWLLGFGLFGGLMSPRYIRLLHARGPGHAMPPISVFGPLPKFATIPRGRGENINSSGASNNSNSSSSSRNRRQLRGSHFEMPPSRLPVVFWYDARHLTDQRSGRENTKVDEWCTR